MNTPSFYLNSMKPGSRTAKHNGPHKAVFKSSFTALIYVLEGTRHSSHFVLALYLNAIIFNSSIFWLIYMSIQTFTSALQMVSEKNIDRIYMYSRQN